MIIWVVKIFFVQFTLRTDRPLFSLFRWLSKSVFQKLKSNHTTCLLERACVTRSRSALQPHPTPHSSFCQLCSSHTGSDTRSSFPATLCASESLCQAGLPFNPPHAWPSDRRSMSSLPKGLPGLCCGRSPRLPHYSLSVHTVDSFRESTPICNYFACLLAYCCIIVHCITCCLLATSRW